MPPTETKDGISEAAQLPVLQLPDAESALRQALELPEGYATSNVAQAAAAIKEGAMQAFKDAQSTLAWADEQYAEFQCRLREVVAQAQEQAMQQDLSRCLAAVDAFIEDLFRRPSFAEKPTDDDIDEGITRLDVRMAPEVFTGNPGALQEIFEHVDHADVDGRIREYAWNIALSVLLKSTQEMEEGARARITQEMDVRHHSAGRTHGLGANWQSGTLRILGKELGDKIGWQMRGGEVRVSAESIGDQLFDHMHGGKGFARADNAIGDDAGAWAKNGKVVLQASRIGDYLGAHARSGMSIEACATEIGNEAGHYCAGRMLLLGNVGHRAGSSMESPGRLIIHGNVGKELGSGAYGYREVHGNAGDVPAIRQMSGTTIIHGKAGTSACYAMNGGVFRATSTDKSCCENMQGGFAKVGSAGCAAGFKMGGGTLVVDHAGSNTGMSAGKGATIIVGEAEDFGDGEARVRHMRRPWYKFWQPKPKKEELLPPNEG